MSITDSEKSTTQKLGDSTRGATTSTTTTHEKETKAKAEADKKEADIKAETTNIVEQAQKGAAAIVGQVQAAGTSQRAFRDCEYIPFVGETDKFLSHLLDRRSHSG